MKSFGLAVLLAATAAGVAMQGQTPDKSSGVDKVTVTGCVQKASAEGPTGTSGTAGVAQPDTQFILANASPSATGTSGRTNPPSSTAMAARRYRLDDAEQSKIAPHVNHKVEITGSIDQSASTTGSSAPAPKLKVESVRMIASTCSE